MPNLTGKLPMMGEDAFDQGFLSKSFGNKVIARVNRPWKVVLPPGGGTGWVMESEENITLNLTSAKLGWDGTWNEPTPPPYLPPWNLYPTMRGTVSVPCTYANATGIWTCTNTNHGLVVDAPVTITLSASGTMASSFTAGTTYYARDITDTTIKLAATAGGAAITGGTDGSGMFLNYAGIALKINPISTLMETWDHRTYWKDATWKDKVTVTNFTNTFVLTAAAQVVWLEVVFSSGTMTSYTIKSGTAWNADLRYVSADNGVLGSGSFTWYQLLGYLKLSSDPGGSANDIKISGSWYKLMCPTTTHLMQSYVTGSIYPYADPFNPEAHFALVPWFGCVWSGS
jgi:hypothetical protein